MFTFAKESIKTLTALLITFVFKYCIEFIIDIPEEYQEEFNEALKSSDKETVLEA